MDRPYRLPPLNSLRAFEAAAHHGNFSRAAEELCVTHGAISRQVAKLEVFLHAQLFERRHQHLKLTIAGQAYAHRLDALFCQVAAATDELFDRKCRKPGLRICVLPTFATRFLLPRLARFDALCPEIRLQIDTDHEPPDPTPSTASAVIRIGMGDQWPNLKCEPLFQETLVAVASPNLVGKKRLHSAEQFHRFKLLHALHRPTDWQRWLGVTGACNVDPHDGLRLEHSGLVCQAALDGLGIALVQPAFVSEELRSGQLIQLLEYSLRTDRSYHIAFPPYNSARPDLQAFGSWLKEEITSVNRTLDRLYQDGITSELRQESVRPRTHSRKMAKTAR